MAAAYAWRSARDHRSNANDMDFLSRSRNSGLMWASKLTVSPGPGSVAEGWSSAVLAWAGASAGGPAGPQPQRDTAISCAAVSSAGRAAATRELQSR